MASAAGPLKLARAAFERRAWAEVRERFADARASGPIPVEDLERLAVASYLIGEVEGFVRALADAHRAHLDQGARGPAARCAFWIGFHFADTGESGLASGWMRRAERSLDKAETDRPERGYLMIPLGQRQLGTGDYDACMRTALEIEEMAERHGDEDLLTLALHMRGRARLRAGQVAEGLPLLDEAMIAVISDRLTPHVTGILYCSIIAACREVWALDRAREWTDALTVWCERQPEMVPYSGECRVFRAEILQREGAWRAAIEEAERALGLGGPQGRGTRGAALYEQAEAHRLLGELAASEEGYRQASAAGFEPQPGLALLRLAQGEHDVARAALERALTESARHRRARLLPAYVEVLVESGDLEGARGACEELAELARAWDSGALATTVMSCRGAIALAAGEPREAVPLLRRAWEDWSALSSPYEAARAQGLLGLACRRLGDEDGARLALGAARSELERLGATTALARLDAAFRGSEAADHHGLTPREREVLAQVATGRTNRAIAEALFISEKTVARHVANIFSKLGLSSRAAATAYAYEHGLRDPSA